MVTSYTQLLSTEKFFKVYLNNQNITTQLISEAGELPLIPKLTSPTFYICGLSDGSGGVTSGSHADISHFQIYSATGDTYANGSKMNTSSRLIFSFHS